MESRERFWKAFELEEPDRVPITELGIDIPHIEAVTGKEYRGGVVVGTLTLEERSQETDLIDLTVECYRKLGFDMIVGGLSTPDGWKPDRRPDGTLIEEWGRILYYDAKCKKWFPGGKTIFEFPGEWENFELPDASASGRGDGLEYMRRLVEGEMVLAGRIRDPFALLWEMFTPINFVKWMYQDPEFIRRMFERVTAYNIEEIKVLADCGAELIISGGDWCEVNGPMVPLKFFREVIFPNLRRQVDAAHNRDLKFVKHTDGNINSLLEDLRSILDGLHSLDPSAGVDIGEVKDKCGDKIVLMGNVSVDNLARKSRDEIIYETKKCIKRASHGGGHILSSSNTWFTDTKLENCLAMVQTAKKFGVYPVHL